MMMELAYGWRWTIIPLVDPESAANTYCGLVSMRRPDGRDRYVDWYFGTRSAKKAKTTASPAAVLGKYIFHDNNRDINYSQVTMRNWLKFYLEWNPPICTIW